MTRGKSESLMAPQSTILLLLEGLLFTQNFMGCPNLDFVENVPYISELQREFYKKYISARYGLIMLPALEIVQAE